MIEPDTRLDHLMAAAIAKFGVAAVLEQLFNHVTFSARYGPPSLFEKTMDAGRSLLNAMNAIRELQAMEAQREKQTD